MNYASTSIDRRAQYYARSAPLIAADPLDFYTRAERGRRFIASRFTPPMEQPSLLADAPAPTLTALRLKNGILAA